MINILFLLNPNSIHDEKWIDYFKEKDGFNKYFICRARHYDYELCREFEKKYNIQFISDIKDFSTVRFFSTISNYLKLIRLIQKCNISIFHIMYGEPNALWALIKIKTKIKVIITTRGTDVLKTIPSHFGKQDFLNQIVKRLYKKAFLLADWITATSQKQVDSIEHFSSRKYHNSLVRTGVDLKELNKETSSFFRKEITKPFLLFPRYIWPIYNHELSIKGISKLNPKIRNEFQMVFVGKDSGDREYQTLLVNQMNKLPEIDFVFLPELSQQEIWELYKRTSLVVMTPTSDGSSVSAMEAMACNKNIIIGPLNYDQAIFKNPLVHQLKNWDALELKRKIEYCISLAGSSKLPNDIFHLIDRDSNMEILKNIYLNLSEKSK